LLLGGLTLGAQSWRRPRHPVSKQQQETGLHTGSKHRDPLSCNSMHFDSVMLP
jgi:hypothetical protein